MIHTIMRGGSSSVTGGIVALDDGGAPAGPLTLTNDFQYGGWFNSGSAYRMILFIEKTTANDPIDVDISILISSDGGVTAYPLDLCNNVGGGFDYRVEGIVRISDIGAVDPTRRIVRVDIEPAHDYCIGARYVGGGAPDVEIAAELIG